MVRKWLHIAFIPIDRWLNCIWDSYIRAIKKGKAKPLNEKKKKEITDLNFHITTRMNMIPKTIKRINNECKELYEIVTKREPENYDSTKENIKYAFKLENDLTFNLLIDIDSLLFEINSCCELIGNYLYKIYTFTGKKIAKKDIGKELKKIIKEAGEDIKWFENLDSHRNFFIHEGAPWVAVDVSNENNYDLLIMKENLKAFDDEEKYITLSELSEIVGGFQRAKAILQKHLVDYIDNL